jgi:hypothetical protein
LVGLPFMDIPKMMAMIFAPLLGGSGNWDDYERRLQKWISAFLGPTASEVLMRGMPRLLNIDLSNSMGADSMLFYGNPKEMKEAEIKSWALDQLTGPMVGMVTNVFRALSSDNFAEGLSKFPLPKFINDIMKAYVDSGGKTSAKGRVTGAPLSPAAIITRAAGLPLATPSEYRETGPGADLRDKKLLKDERDGLMSKWIGVPPGAGRGSARAKIFNEEIRTFNKGKRGSDRIDVGDLQRLERSRAKLTRGSKRELEKSQ